VHKQYHPPATPYQRMLADERTPDEARARLRALSATLDPVRLLRDIRAAQQRLADLTNASSAATVLPVGLDEFLSGLKTAWRSGEIRPTAKKPPQPKRGRRRPDPLVEVTEKLKLWFDAEPRLTARELLERLQAELPKKYPDGLLRTVQRRLKVWRAANAHAVVFVLSACQPMPPVRWCINSRSRSATVPPTSCSVRRTLSPALQRSSRAHVSISRGCRVPIPWRLRPEFALTPGDRADAGKCSPAKEAQRSNRCTGDPAVLYHRITQRLQRSAHRAADLGAAIEARLCPIASRSA
jgi:hypothetical protein